VGALGTFIDITSLYVFVEYFSTGVITGSIISFLLAVISNFILNKIWTFENKSKNYRKLFIKFLIVSVVGLTLTIISMEILVFVLNIWYILAKAMTSLIVLSWNFLANQFWTFKLKDFEDNSKNNYKYHLSIVIPAYNEESRIKSTFNIIKEYINQQNLDCEIIFVNDGSRDNTQSILDQFCSNNQNYTNIELRKNQGKGHAVMQGILAA